MELLLNGTLCDFASTHTSHKKLAEILALQSAIYFILDKEMRPNLACNTSKELELHATLFAEKKYLGVSVEVLEYITISLEFMVIEALPLALPTAKGSSAVSYTHLTLPTKRIV